MGSGQLNKPTRLKVCLYFKNTIILFGFLLYNLEIRIKDMSSDLHKISANNRTNKKSAESKIGKPGKHTVSYLSNWAVFFQTKLAHEVGIIGAHLTVTDLFITRHMGCAYLKCAKSKLWFLCICSLQTRTHAVIQHGTHIKPKKTKEQKKKADTYIILNIPSTNVTALQVIHLHK